jgi:DNA-binding MarR family transcriptional regulator
MKLMTGKLVLQLANELIKKRNETSTQFDLTAGQMTFVVFLLRHQDRVEINQLDIEKEFGLTHQTVTGIISRLKTKGFVECFPSLRDKRFKAIRLREKALSIQVELERLTENADALMIKGMTADEQNTFQRLLQNALNQMTR